MTAFMEFTIPSDAFVLGEILDVNEAKQIELTQFVPIGDVFIPNIWVETDDEEAVRSEVLTSPHIASVERLHGATERVLFQMEWEESVDGLLENLQSHDLAVQRAVSDTKRWKFQLIAAERATFGKFESACEKDGFDLTVTQLSDSIARDSSLYGLTDKQRDSLLLAYNSGYYDSTKSVSIAELSEQVGVSQQALGARLKRGTGSLIENTIGLIGDYDE